MLVRKFIILFFIGAVFLYGKVQDVELLANSVSKNGDILNAKDNVVLYSKEYLVTADMAKYDQKNQIVEFFGNVNILKNEFEISKTNYFKLELEDDKSFAAENFIMNKQSEFWIQNNESCSDKKYYKTKGSIVSSCNIQNPDWKISFSSGKLNKKSQFLHLYNPVFYIKNIPILYLPYFGFSTNKERKTGLLIPEVGYKRKEGFYYKQPIYFAPYKNWDLQIDPQIRTRRGAGVYSTFRFVDSPYSYGEIRGGVFENKEKHQKRLEYKNKKHHGFELEYDRSNLVNYLISGDFKDRLWLDFKYVNDVEYFDLKSRGGGSDNMDSLVTSKMNYFLTNDDYYFGIYARYYIDTDKLNSKYIFKNDDTVQELPTLQYHKFLNSLFLDNLTYSIDSKYHNYTRKDGVTANQYELNVPISFNASILNGYLNLQFSENIYATYIDYDNNFRYANNYLYKDKSDNYINHYHQISLSSDLAKPYKNYFHTMNMSIDYTIPGYQHGNIVSKLFRPHQYKHDKNNHRLNISKLKDVSNSLYYENNFINELSKDYTQENIKANFTQYLFYKNGKKFIRHSVSQGYDFDDDDLANLNHKIDIYLQNGFSFGNKFEYSHDNHNFEKVQTYAKYKDEKMSISLRHAYENLKKYESKYDKDSYLIFDFSAKLPDNYIVFTRFDYDLEREYAKMWRIGFTKQKKCWNYSIIYQEDIEPKTSSSLDYQKASKEQSVYFFVNFYPFGGVSYDFSKNINYV